MARHQLLSGLSAPEASPPSSGPPEWAREGSPRRVGAQQRPWRRAGACPLMSPPLPAQARAGRRLARARCALLQRGRATAGLPRRISALAPGPLPAGLRQRAVRRRTRGHHAASDTGLAGSQLTRTGNALMTGGRPHLEPARGLDPASRGLEIHFTVYLVIDRI